MASPQPQDQPTAIANAIADVTAAAQQIVEDRIDLLRLQARNDVRVFLGAATMTAAGIGAVFVAVGAGAAAVVWTLALWIPTGLALAIVAVASLVAGVVLTNRSRKRIPAKLADASTPAALPEGEPA